MNYRASLYLITLRGGVDRDINLSTRLSQSTQSKGN